jgi:translation initiation factor 2 subunit 3
MGKKKNKKEETISSDDLGAVPKEQVEEAVNPPESSEPIKETVEKTEEEPEETKANEEILKPKIEEIPETNFRQSETNIGFCGHVDHGKTTLVKALSGVWTERYQDELNRGITIKLGYAETEMVQCPTCNKIYTMNLANNLKPKKAQKGTCPDDGTKLDFRRRISFVDAPGHEILMATMLSGASLMDGAILLISATEPCPMPQTREHLAALEIVKIEKIIIVQNKIDAVSKEKALEHFHQIKDFIKGTIAEKAPIIPVSAIFNANIDMLAAKIEELIPTPEFDDSSDLLFNVARSFDVNKPGSQIEELKGGVIGGSIVQGKVTAGDEIEIRPGIKNQKGVYEPVITRVMSIFEGNQQLRMARPGGLIALGTELDPSYTKSDQFIGNVAGKPGSLPDVLTKVQIETHLLDKVLGAEEEIIVEPIKRGEFLMITAATMASAGMVTDLGKNTMYLDLKRPICSPKGAIIALSRRINDRFRLIGYGYLQ